MNARPLLLFSGVLLSGCAAPAVPPEPIDHPANPAAAAAPPPAPSVTLALDAPRRPATAPVRAGAYTCPHHPQVVSAQPGNCPECGMKLVPKPAAPSAPAHPPGHDAHPSHGGRQ